MTTDLVLNRSSFKHCNTHPVPCHFGKHSHRCTYFQRRKKLYIIEFNNNVESSGMTRNILLHQHLSRSNRGDKSNNNYITLRGSFYGAALCTRFYAKKLVVLMLIKQTTVTPISIVRLRFFLLSVIARAFRVSGALAKNESSWVHHLLRAALTRFD